MSASESRKGCGKYTYCRARIRELRVGRGRSLAAVDGSEVGDEKIGQGTAVADREVVADKALLPFDFAAFPGGRSVAASAASAAGAGDRERRAVHVVLGLAGELADPGPPENI